MTETKASKRLATAKKYIDNFAALDQQVLEDILADNYTHTFAPASITPNPGPYDKRGFIGHFTHIGEVMTAFPVTGLEYIDSEAASRVTVWATSRPEWRDDVKDADADAESEVEWDYRGEYVFFFTMDESGEKIVRTVEFLDSKQTVDRLMPLMRRARENQAKRMAGSA